LINAIGGAPDGGRATAPQPAITWVSSRELR